MVGIHKLNRGSINLLELARPSQLIEFLEIRLVSFGEAAERAIVHDRKLILLSEEQGGSTLFTNQRKEVPETERVADLMAKRRQLLLLCLAKENRINVQPRPAPIGKESTGEHASVRIAVVRGPHNNFEVPSIRALRKFDWGGIAPCQ